MGVLRSSHKLDKEEEGRREGGREERKASREGGEGGGREGGREGALTCASDPDRTRRTVGR